MNNFCRKEYISLDVKNAVWERDSIYPCNKEITKCRTCLNLVMIPESIRKRNMVSYDIKEIYVNGKRKRISGVAEFGHIISEKNGGKANEANLIIQCKGCNVSQGSKNIDFINLINECEMIDANLDEDNEIEMGEHSGVCQGKCVNRKKCRNKPIFNRKYCHIHLNK